MSVVLRCATSEDAPHVAEVYLASRKAFLPYAPLAHSDEEVREWVREVLIPTGNVVIACVGGAVVGMLSRADAPDARWIHHLYVAPGYTGQGIGTRMLVHALSLLEPPVRLYVFQANARARTFYERHGFRAIKFGDGRDNEERCPDVLYELGPAERSMETWRAEP